MEFLSSRVMGVHGMRAVSRPHQGMIAYVVRDMLIVRAFSDELQFPRGEKKGFSLPLSESALNNTPIGLSLMDEWVLFAQGGHHALISADGTAHQFVAADHPGHIRRWFSHRYQEMSRSICISDQAGEHVAVVADGHLYFANEIDLAETGEIGATRVSLAGYLGSGAVSVTMHESGEMAAVACGRHMLLVEQNGTIRNLGFGRGIQSAASMWFANGELVAADTKAMLWQRFRLSEPVAA